MTMAGKGILAMDESNATCGSRLEGVGVENIEENRRRYRELLITTPDLGEHIGGAILFEETLYQSCADGTSFVDALKAQGIDEIVVYCVNDGAVMTAWRKDQGCGDEAVGGSLLKFYGDPTGAFTRACGLVLDHPGWTSLAITLASAAFMYAAWLCLSSGAVRRIEAETDTAHARRCEESRWLR